MRVSRRLLWIATLVGWGAGAFPAAVRAHEAAVGHILRQNGEVIEHAFMGQVYGDIRVSVATVSDPIEVTFLDEDSLEVTFGNPYELRWVMIDTTVARYQPAGAWSFVLHGGPNPGTTQLFLRLWDVDHSAYTSPPNPVVVENRIGIAPGEAPAGEPFRLLPVVPNPFNPSTLVRYEVSTPSWIHLRVFDAQGRAVATLMRGQVPAGRHAVRWDAASRPSGVYFVELAGPGRSETRKIVLSK
jgi:hypothetical protein